MAGNKLINYHLHNYAEDIIHFGCDYLGISIQLDDYDFSQIYEELSMYTSNSNSREEYISDFGPNSFLTFTNNFHRGDESQYLHVTLTTDEVTQTILQFGRTQQYAKITVYGKFFRLCRIHDIEDQFGLLKKIMKIMDFFDKIHKYDQWTLWRFDFCIDIRNQTVEQLYNSLAITKKEKFYKDKATIETVYIGSRDSHYAFVRIYNKLLEVAKNNNQTLYKDYYSNDEVTRIEFQFLKTFCTGFNFEQIDKIYQKIYYYIGFIDSYHGKMRGGKRYDKDFILDKHKYASKIKNMLVKGSNNGIDFRPILQEVNLHQKHNYFRVKKRK